MAKYYRAGDDYESEKEINEAGIALCEKMKPNLMKYRWQTFFHQFHGELLLNRFNEADKAEKSFDKAIRFGEAGLRMFPADREIHRSMLFAHLLRSRVAETNDDLDSSQLHVSHAEKLVVGYANRQQEPSEGVQLLYEFTKARITSLCEKNQFIEARDMLNQLVSIAPRTSRIRYHVARSMCIVVGEHRLAGFPRDERIEIESQAFDHLETAVELGFSDFDSLRSDPEWRAVSTSGRYKKILQRQ